MENLTEDELVAWEERHDNIIAWESMWRKLTIILSLIALYLVWFTDHLIAGGVFSISSMVFLIAMHVCIRRHYKMHEELGDLEE